MSAASALFSVLFGLAAMPALALIRLIGNKAGFTAVKVLLDVVGGLFLAAGPIAIGCFLNDGIVKVYMLLFAGAGFAASHAIAAALPKRKRKGKE